MNITIVTFRGVVGPLPAIGRSCKLVPLLEAVKARLPRVLPGNLSPDPGPFQIGQEIHNLPNVGFQLGVLTLLQAVKHGENYLLIGLDDVIHWNIWQGVDRVDERGKQAVGVQQTLQLELVLQIIPHCAQPVIVAAPFLKQKIK
jgi:hypothetical protein